VRRSVHAGSSLYTLDDELLERLAPDLILTQELCAVCAVSYEIVARAAKRLRGDPRIVSLEPSSLEDVFSTIGTVGDLTDTRERAEDVVTGLRQRVARLQEQTRAMPHPRTLVLEWTDPPMSAGHWTPELVELAGGEHVLAHPGRNSETLTWDAIAAADPDAVIIAPCGFDLKATLRACDEMAENAAWTGLRAVRGSRAFAVDGNAYVNRPGPRLVDSAEIFASALHAGMDRAADKGFSAIAG
jgi:iron complex transport system substrate-binding protein